MFTSYIIDKKGFTILCMLIGGKAVKIPERFYDTVDENNYESVLKKLSDVGYAYISDSHTDIERTMHFLISSVLGAENVSIENDGKRYIFQCEKLIIIIEEDRLSPKKCKIIPIKDNEMLMKYYSELSDEINYDEEERL